MHLSVTILAKDDPPLHPELAKLIKDDKCGEIERVCVIEDGAQPSGKPSVTLIVRLDGGGYAAVETSAALFLMAAGAVRGACHRFGFPEMQ